MQIRLREIRENLEITQKTVAKQLKLSPTIYNYFENKERIIPLKHLNNFCNLYNVSADYILGLSNINIYPSKKCKLNKKLIGSRVKEIRKKNNHTQQDLANLFNTTQSTISAYESGKTIILTAFLYTMCKEFNVSIDYIMGRRNTINIIIE